jgi:hypothetical protein
LISIPIAFQPIQTVGLSTAIMWIPPSRLQRAFRAATKLGKIYKPVNLHTLRHSFAMHLLPTGDDIRRVQELIDYNYVKTTMIFSHLLNRGKKVVRNLLDDSTLFSFWSVAEKVSAPKVGRDDPEFPGVTYYKGASCIRVPVLSGTATASKRL